MSVIRETNILGINLYEKQIWVCTPVDIIPTSCYLHIYQEVIYQYSAQCIIGDLLTMITALMPKVDHLCTYTPSSVRFEIIPLLRLCVVCVIHMLLVVFNSLTLHVVVLCRFLATKLVVGCCSVDDGID